MRVVIDTNVLVSGLLTPSGACGQMVELLIAGRLEPCVDGRILDDYRDVLLHRPRLAIPLAQGLLVLDAIAANADHVAPMPLPARVDDPVAAAFLEVTVAAGVGLVTGSLRRYPREARHGIPVLSPQGFLDFVRAAL